MDYKELKDIIRGPHVSSLEQQVLPLIAEPPKSTNLAEWAYERVKSLIFDFEKELSPDEEIGCRLVSFNANSVYYIDDIGYWGPDIIMFYCTDSTNNAKATLIQHISQLNVLLLKLPRKNGDKEARRIGFNIKERETDE